MLIAIKFLFTVINIGIQASSNVNNKLLKRELYCSPWTCLPVQ